MMLSVVGGHTTYDSLVTEGAGRYLSCFSFFLIGFVLLTSLTNLALLQFSIEMGVISSAIVGALLAATATLTVEETPIARWLEHYRRIIAVIVKVLLYGATSLLFLFAERLLGLSIRFTIQTRRLGM